MTIDCCPRPLRSIRLRALPRIVLKPLVIRFEGLTLILFFLALPLGFGGIVLCLLDIVRCLCGLGLGLLAGSLLLLALQFGVLCQCLGLLARLLLGCQFGLELGDPGSVVASTARPRGPSAGSHKEQLSEVWIA